MERNILNEATTWAWVTFLVSQCAPRNQTLADTIEVALLNTIISPASDVPMDVILDFKRKRRSELIAFWSAVDELYLGVINTSCYAAC